MSTLLLCQLCEQPVMLETARINELGKAVHEDCYVRALQSARLSNSHGAPIPDSTT